MKMKKILNVAIEIADTVLLAAITAIGFTLFFVASTYLALLLS